MLLQIQINFKPQLHAVFVPYVTGVNTTNIFTWMWDEKQLTVFDRVNALGRVSAHPLSDRSSCTRVFLEEMFAVKFFLTTSAIAKSTLVFADWCAFIDASKASQKLLFDIEKKCFSQ